MSVAIQLEAGVLEPFVSKTVLRLLPGCHSRWRVEQQSTEMYM